MFVTAKYWISFVWQKSIGSINITDINVRPASSDPTHKDIKLTFHCEPGYPENWKEEFDRMFTEYVK